jgi:hypothetical protein
MIINIWCAARNLYFVRDLDSNFNMFIGSYDECKDFQIKYNDTQSC